MGATSYTLVVQSDLEERQIRRLGAAVALLWPSLPAPVRESLLAQATMIHISGEATAAEDLRKGLSQFLNSRPLPNG